ncbi:hypothetical protein, partial [Flavobacterium helocola]
FASMATSGFSYGKSATEWNVLLYLYWLGVGSTPLKASLITLCATYFPNLRRKLLSYFFRKKFIEIVTEKILRDSRKPNRTLSINFVLKLRFRENPL